jgi:excisionase family DNA binding protein
MEATMRRPAADEGAIRRLLVTIPEAAAMLSVSPGSVRQMLARGELRLHRVGRLHRVALSDLERLAAGE